MADWIERIRLHSLKTLLSLERTRNISRSAAEMNITQPALSKWLKELETDIGLPLFERHARGLRPTRYGEALLAHAHRIDAHLESARDDMTVMRDGSTGRVVIGLAGVSAGSIAPLAVMKLIEAYPQAAIDLVESPVANLLERLSAGEIDIVVGRRAADYADLGLNMELLYSDPVKFIVRPGHPLLDGRRIGWDDLLSYRWIVWPKSIPIRESVDETLRALGHQVPPLSIESNAVTLNLTLLTMSDMICLASYRDTLRYMDWNIARPLPFVLAVSGEVAMYWRNDGDRRPMLTAMLQCLKDIAHQPVDDNHNPVVMD